MYLVKLSSVYHAYPSTIGDRAVSKETAAQNWKAAYPEHAASIEVIDAPEADADGNPFKATWGRSYKKTPRGYEVHAKGRQ